MISILIFLCVFGAIFGGLFGIICQFDSTARLGGIVCLAISAICIASLFGFGATDIQRQINANNVKETIGVVQDVSGNDITLAGGNHYKKIEQYNANLDGIKMGDLVKIKYLDANFGNYIVKVTELNVTEKQ
jgi:hypothetical protein